MFYLILLVMIALVYIFMMPKDIRRSMDIFFFTGAGVLLVSLGIAQAVDSRGLLLEILIVGGIIVLTVRSIIEIERFKGK
ncbi:DUF3165 family protein [Lactococcus termiticola]|uniref:DUF3165 domain-containing protein n=1 Tax=Lactococcus termiticola TaxID=2169526 RepID=A0A2R5HKM3_9LACT|nr:DUF3165 family protein [Lactococcus termiticola]GBG97450.1 hypothetical protein NtB2_01595 [Lactococcus termiticola]